MTFDASGVDEYLVTTRQLIERLNLGVDPLEAVVTAIGELEKFVRTPPGDAVLISAGPLDPVPITKDVVGRMDDLAHGTNGEVSYGLAAVQRLGILVTGIRALELKTQELERRLAELDEDGPG